MRDSFVARQERERERERERIVLKGFGFFLSEDRDKGTSFSFREHHEMVIALFRGFTWENTFSPWFYRKLNHFSRRLSIATSSRTFFHINHTAPFDLSALSRVATLLEFHSSN